MDRRGGSRCPGRSHTVRRICGSIGPLDLQGFGEFQQFLTGYGIVGPDVENIAGMFVEQEKPGGGAVFIGFFEGDQEYQVKAGYLPEGMSDGGSGQYRSQTDNRWITVMPVYTMAELDSSSPSG